MRNSYTTSNEKKRKNNNKGELLLSGVLTQERIAKLNALGFRWSFRTVEPDQWEQRYDELSDFKEEYGHFRVCRHQKYQLWAWIKTQRACYRNAMKAMKLEQERRKGARASAATAAESENGGDDVGEKKYITCWSCERIVKLQMIGFQWEVQSSDHEATWETRFLELLKYKAETGHTRVPKRNYETNLELASWVKTQRRTMTRVSKDGNPRWLTEEKIRRLNVIGFEWRLKPEITVKRESPVLQLFLRSSCIEPLIDQPLSSWKVIFESI
jgi:hypothetical protein